MVLHEHHKYSAATLLSNSQLGVAKQQENIVLKYINNTSATTGLINKVVGIILMQRLERYAPISKNMLACISVSSILV
jgi:hypothetical protein